MLKREMIETLGRRRIVLYPDKGDAFNEWRKKGDKDMRGLNIEISDLLESKPNIDERMDIADYFIIKQRYNNGKGS